MMIALHKNARTTPAVRQEIASSGETAVVLADLGSFIYADGHEASLGNVTGRMADIDLADNPFFREFADKLDTSAVVHVPSINR